VRHRQHQSKGKTFEFKRTAEAHLEAVAGVGPRRVEAGLALLQGGQGPRGRESVSIYTTRAHRARRTHESLFEHLHDAGEHVAVPDCR
jgi:hypothetical protein